MEISNKDCRKQLNQRKNLEQSVGSLVGLFLSILFIGSQSQKIQAQVISQSPTFQNLAQATTVRILALKSSGSGVIVQKQGQVYTVLTNWHVLEFADRHTILTFDGKRHTPISQPKQLGNNDLAVIQFRSENPYQIVRINTEKVQVGDRVFATGFPMYRDHSPLDTFDLGVRSFRFTEGVISLLPERPLRQGYRLGYSNDIVIGMSGGPIFNAAGLLIGVNGRSKNRDPDFGVYSFDDGSQPSARLLEQIVKASWGIPITAYLPFVTHPNPVTFRPVPFSAQQNKAPQPSIGINSAKSIPVPVPKPIFLPAPSPKKVERANRTLSE